MKRSLFVLTSFLLISAICTTVRSSSPPYRNLYGFDEDRRPLSEIVGKMAIGGLNFLQEGERDLASELKDSVPRFDQEYDFVVIGAGSAGATVAARLSEIRGASVLLIEAGRNENLVMDIPLLVHFFQQNSNVNWKYQTEPSDTYCRGMTERRCNWPRGKVMGGSSVLNYMIATRGHPLDYDGWASMGNDGWSYQEVLKYFKKLENLGIPELRDNEKMHNTEGPVSITYPPFHTPLAEAFLEAGLEMGYPTIDYNADEHVGFSYIQSTMKNGTRMSTNRAYLYPAHERSNLFVSKFSHVNRVLINPKTRRAYGVEFTKLERNIRVRAKKEVILCAGTIGSAQILMLSGVGPSEHLREMNVPVIQDAPVGENLMDHIAYGGLVFLVDQPVGIIADLIADPLNPYVSDFLINKNGPLTSPGGCEALAFIDVDKPRELDAFPNVELLFIAASLTSDDAVHRNIGISEEYWNEMVSKIKGKHSWTIFPMLMRPRSKGKILLRSNDPKVKPKIFANYLDDPEDVRVMVKGVRAAIEVSRTEAMRRFNSTLFNFPIPGCEDFEYDSEEYWECAIRTFTFTIYHHAGTCKMAPEDDETGVVNPRLQVKGIKGLRVADASVMPMIITGHTNIPVIMIGEKLADMVKEDWGYKTKV